MLEKDKVETIRNKDMIGEYLFERGVSSNIIENPRYESILWKLSNILRKMKLSYNVESAKSYLSSIISIEEDGSIILLEGEGPNNTIVSSKYMYDIADDKLKRLRVESKDGIPNIQTISIYNDDDGYYLADNKSLLKFNDYKNAIKYKFSNIYKNNYIYLDIN